MDSLELLYDMGLNVKPYRKIYRVIKYNSENTKREIVEKKPIYYLFLRGSGNSIQPSIESQLKNQAKKLGIEFRFSETIRDPDIIATGTRKANIFSYGGIFENVNMEEAVYVLYDFKYAPKGYIYILPYYDNKALIANVCFDKTKTDQVKDLFYKLLKENNVIKSIIRNAELIETRYGTGGYHNNFYEGMDKDHYLIGEAAGFIDPARGFGLRYAFLSGFLVAKAIVKNLNFKELWQKSFGTELKDGFKRRKVFNKLNNKKLNELISNMDKKSSLGEYTEKRSKFENKAF
ncbi:MAG: hypothetical protein BAJALOKI2v1_940015 [Promethearchaeota archaeon]|nr:MAG: hypothetical protein BAJALOKI2v1_940015 [Candidatus Lokiarchaeota archaeon]